MLSFTLSGKTYTWTTNNIDRRKLNRIQSYTHTDHIFVASKTIILANAFHVVQNMCIYHIIPCLSHIFFLFLVICLYRILDLFYIISCIIFFASFLYFHVHFLSCSYTVHVSYTFIYRILSSNLSYTVLYFYLHSYTFHIRYFCMLSSVFHLFLVFSSFKSMTYYILCTITYIISYPIPISCLFSCSGYMPILYYSFLTYCFIIYFLIQSCIIIYFAFAFSL